ncbi:hypothetical protein HID58_094923 [Brassica napus]|uniref:Uncharacterized protein n=1 Tax=Brassica napus TaxID=3708 RepID=A0ABQ7X5G9_BRANA|nr:hypothetical protein HID58_094923 [Brassica napus]
MGNVIRFRSLRAVLSTALAIKQRWFKLHIFSSLNISSNISRVFYRTPSALKPLDGLTTRRMWFLREYSSSIGNLSYLTHLDLQGNGFHRCYSREQAQWKLSPCTTQLTELTWIEPTWCTLTFEECSNRLWKDQRCYSDKSIRMLDISSKRFSRSISFLLKSIFGRRDSERELRNGFSRHASCEQQRIHGSITSFNTIFRFCISGKNNLSGKFLRNLISVGLIHLMSVAIRYRELPRVLMNALASSFSKLRQMFNDTFPSWLSCCRICSFESSYFEKYLQWVMPWITLLTGAMSQLHTFTDNKQERLFRGNYHKSVVLAIKGSGWSCLGVFQNVQNHRCLGKPTGRRYSLNHRFAEGLIVLNMSKQRFHWPYSTIYSNLTNLQSLDLSGNRLSGNIPPELGKLSFLALMELLQQQLEVQYHEALRFKARIVPHSRRILAYAVLLFKKTCGSGGEEVYEIVKEENDQVVELDCCLK